MTLRQIYSKTKNQNTKKRVSNKRKLSFNEFIEIIEKLPFEQWDKFRGVYSDVYFRTLYDPCQDVALYGSTPEEIDWFKKTLKSLGCGYFRLVKNGHCPILCFALPKVKIQ